MIRVVRPIQFIAGLRFTATFPYVSNNQVLWGTATLSTLWNTGIQKLQSWQLQTKVCMDWREQDGCGEAGTKPRRRATKTSFSVRDTQTDSLTQSAVMQIIHHNHSSAIMLCHKKMCPKTTYLSANGNHFAKKTSTKTEPGFKCGFLDWLYER